MIILLYASDALQQLPQESCNRFLSIHADNDSEFNIEGEGPASEKVQANAKMVAECGRPLEHGAWKGCAKSAW